MNDANEPIVIVGGGHAAAQLCGGLAAAGQGARVHLVCEEPQLPYHRPPLSKSFLKSLAEPVQPHRGEDWYREAGITRAPRRPGGRHRPRPAHACACARARELGYGRLVLATGARARSLPRAARRAGQRGGAAQRRRRAAAARAARAAAAA